MQFLKTLFWVLLAVFLALLASRNWFDVTLSLWGDVRADIKAPILLLSVFLLGFLPPFLILRGRLWALRRRLGVTDRPVATTAAPPAETAPADEAAVI